MTSTLNIFNFFLYYTITDFLVIIHVTSLHVFLHLSVCSFNNNAIINICAYFRFIICKYLYLLHYTYVSYEYEGLYANEIILPSNKIVLHVTKIMVIYPHIALAISICQFEINTEPPFCVLYSVVFVTIK